MNDPQSSGRGVVRCKDISIPVRLTITASGLLSQIFRAHFNAVGINSSGATTAFTTPQSYIFCGDIGSPIKAISEALCSPEHQNDLDRVEPRNRTIRPNAPALANTPRLTSGKANEALVLAITMSLLLEIMQA